VSLDTVKKATNEATALHIKGLILKKLQNQMKDMTKTDTKRKMGFIDGKCLLHTSECPKHTHPLQTYPLTSLSYSPYQHHVLFSFVDLQTRKPKLLRGGISRRRVVVAAVSPRDKWAIVLISILNYILSTT